MKAGRKCVISVLRGQGRPHERPFASNVHPPDTTSDFTFGDRNATDYSLGSGRSRQIRQHPRREPEALSGGQNAKTGTADVDKSHVETQAETSRVRQNPRGECRDLPGKKTRRGGGAKVGRYDHRVGKYQIAPLPGRPIGIVWRELCSGSPLPPEDGASVTGERLNWGRARAVPSRSPSGSPLVSETADLP